MVAGGGIVQPNTFLCYSHISASVSYILSSTFYLLHILVLCFLLKLCKKKDFLPQILLGPFVNALAHIKCYFSVSLHQPVNTKTCVRENVSKRTLNKNLCSTYTVLKPTAIHSHLRDVIGKDRFEETLRVLQQVRISPKDIQLLNQASGILGDEHRSRLLSLLQITCQQN